MTNESTDKSSSSGDMHEWLKNGVVLCNLINVLQPGAVKKINNSTMAFKMVGLWYWVKAGPRVVS